MYKEMVEKAGIKDKIRTIPHFPKQGIMFRDITTLLQDAKGFRDVVQILTARYRDVRIDAVAGIEARGFILGGALAHNLNVGFVPIRKKGKLPYKVERQEYDLEYGKDVIEVHIDSIKKGDQILIVDDLLATGGTAGAAANLVKKLGGEIVEIAFLVDLPALGGRKKLEAAGNKVFTMVEFEGE
ncbi:MAG: adenine phosphoribosyltransferase [Nanoarchaeota archaeon]|nr:adenine phosphoribosyltransferase [Nanoarchaeota archaeon]